MHYFPSDKNLNQTWVKFVCRHRKDFIPSKTSCLCLVHFKDSCFERRPTALSEESEFKFKRFLIKGSTPTRDTVVPYSSPETKRKRQKVKSIVVFFCCSWRDVTHTQNKFAKFVRFFRALKIN